jgi:hypothetical protein
MHAAAAPQGDGAMWALSDITWSPQRLVRDTQRRYVTARARVCVFVCVVTPRQSATLHRVPAALRACAARSWRRAAPRGGQAAAPAPAAHACVFLAPR